MKELEGRTAVVTGAASGIGLGITEALAHRGMKVVMADVEEEVLREEATRLQKSNFDVTPCLTDVRSQDAIENLLAAAIRAYDRVHVLCNNAGVGGSGGNAVWEADQKDWDWIMGVNLQGVINGIRVFTPHMLDYGEESHIVNTSSILGLTTGAGSIYGVSKHAVARLTEGLFHDLRNRNAKTGVTLLCPGMIATNILTSARNRPAELQNPTTPDPERDARLEQLNRIFQTEGMSPRQVGELVAEAILENRFYLLTHSENLQGVERRFDDIMGLKNPSPPPPGRFGPPAP